MEPAVPTEPKELTVLLQLPNLVKVMKYLVTINVRSVGTFENQDGRN